ncbi:MAG: TCP-1/cpn60 chaperonin family protein [Steroidobacteraceae bacterium]
MSSKQVLFRSKAREKVLSGATQLADAVRITLGPKSKSVLIQKNWGAPIVCNDGVTIAKEMELEDPEENLGAQMLRQAAEKTGDLVGDERTGVQILRRALEAPTRQIAENSAADGGVVVDRMLNATGNVGFDAAGKAFVDLFEAGIVDPAKVVRVALENAVSIAGVLLLTEATMTEKREKHAEAAASEAL